MEYIVYILGAGFSAPLGLPVVRTFLPAAKDLYFKDSERFKGFKTVFERIDALARLKNVFDSDLLDIEEILSILELDGEYGGGVARDQFVALIRDVISAYTPCDAAPNVSLGLPWGLFGRTALSSYYGCFVANLCGFGIVQRVAPDNTAKWFCEEQPERNTSYSVINLNYDRVLENVWDFVKAHHQFTQDFSFLRNALDPAQPRRCPLVKLHGSVDSDLIPPTSAKIIASNLRPAWETAFKLLQRANHIRVIGYSLPTTDTMVRYLFKAAIARAEHLKSFHVVCLDDRQGSTLERYEKFVTFKFSAFTAVNAEQYLEAQASNSWVAWTNPDASIPGALETGHRRFFR